MTGPKFDAVIGAQPELDRARELIRIAESADARNAAYADAADQITAARATAAAGGCQLTQSEIGEAIGKSQSYVARLLKWRQKYADPNTAPPPFGGSSENTARYRRRDQQTVEALIADRPEVIAAAITEADTATQRKFADALVAGTPERSLRSAIAPSKPSPPEPPSAERTLNRATFSLWEVCERLREGERPTGEERIRMIAAAEQAGRHAQRLVYLLEADTLTGQVDDTINRILADEDGTNP